MANLCKNVNIMKCTKWPITMGNKAAAEENLFVGKRGHFWPLMAALHFVYFHDKDLDFQIVNEWVIKPNVWMMALSPKIKMFCYRKVVSSGWNFKGCCGFDYLKTKVIKHQKCIIFLHRFCSKWQLSIIFNWKLQVTKRNV